MGYIYICIGENKFLTQSHGIGNTLEEAIRKWASSDDYASAFNDYKPMIIRGEVIEVEQKVQYVVKG